MMQVQWLGNPPTYCDTCREPIGSTFIDGKTKLGAWANMCPGCFAFLGTGLGTGRGQKYECVDGKWLKQEVESERKAL